MEQHQIEHYLTLSPDFPEDSYRDSMVAILTPPKWYRPFKRAKFYRELDTRIALVMAEYAKDLVRAFTETNETVTDTKKVTGTLFTKDSRANQ